MLLNCGVGEDSWESLGLQGDPTSPSKGDQSWVFIGRSDVEAETPIFWPPHAKSWLIVKDSDAGRDWGQEEKGTTEDEMAGWCHWIDGREFEWTSGVGDGQGGLVCCDSWVAKSRTQLSDWTDWHIPQILFWLGWEAFLVLTKAELKLRFSTWPPLMPEGKVLYVGVRALASH